MTPRSSRDRETFYERMAAKADWDAIANNYETQRRIEIIFERVLGNFALDGLSLLDSGSGGGHFSAAACARGAEVTSLDVGENLLAQVAKRCDSSRVVGSVLELPFADGTFDIVLCSEVIEHTSDPHLALRQLARVTKPGGRIVITTPGRLWQPVVRLATRMRLRPYEGYENFLWPGHTKKTLTQSGIQIDQSFGFNLLPLFTQRLAALHQWSDRAGTLLPQLYVNYLVTGVKG